MVIAVFRSIPSTAISSRGEAWKMGGVSPKCVTRARNRAGPTPGMRERTSRSCPVITGALLPTARESAGETPGTRGRSSSVRPREAPQADNRESRLALLMFACVAVWSPALRGSRRITARFPTISSTSRIPSPVVMTVSVPILKISPVQRSQRSRTAIKPSRMSSM